MRINAIIIMSVLNAAVAKDLKQELLKKQAKVLGYFKEILNSQ